MYWEGFQCSGRGVFSIAENYCDLNPKLPGGRRPYQVQPESAGEHQGTACLACWVGGGRGRGVGFKG